MKKIVLLFDFTTLDGDNVLQTWADDLPLQKRDRGRLDAKIDLLETVGDDLPPKLLQSTKARHIMEIAANGDVAVRVMLCRGPLDMKTEFTFLYGTTEKNRKYVQRDALERADKNRSELIYTPTRRCKHERFIKITQTGL